LNWLKDRKSLNIGFVILSLILFIVNSSVSAYNTSFIESYAYTEFINRMLYFWIYGIMTFLIIYVIQKIKIFFDKKLNKDYLYSKVIVLTCFLFLWMLNFFLQKYIRLRIGISYIVLGCILIGIVIPFLISIFKEYRSRFPKSLWIHGCFILSGIILLLLCRPLSPTNNFILLGLALFAILLGIKKYIYPTILRKKRIIVAALILCLVIFFVITYIGHGQYILHKLYRWIRPDVGNTYEYIRNIFDNARIIGKCELSNPNIYNHFYCFGLIAPSILFYFGWLAFIVYLGFMGFYGYMIYKIINDEMQKKQTMNILLVIFLSYLLFEIVLSCLGAIGLPTVNIQSPFVHLKTDSIIMVVICFQMLRHQSMDVK